ncbi:FMN-dependent NADH-azoreductase [Vibrio sp.]|uniref:FMN-dependent NADH-azoreductase n=1 Tax=Vibrio sp. TaxID=678 RepID=UPI003D0F6959
MANILVLKSSILGEYSQSNHIIDHALEGKADVIVRDLAAEPLPVLDGEIATALRSNGEDLSNRAQQAVALSDQLIAEVNAADTLVIAAPMYNFMIPTQLKNWFDLIARAGVTFRYTENGPEGLLKPQKAIIVTTRGGMHKDSDRDAMSGYLSTILGFLGVSDVSYVYAEALAMGEEPAAESRTNALLELTNAL